MSSQAVRNICIVIGIAVVFALPQMGGLQVLVGLLLRALMLAAFLYFGYTMWRGHKHELEWMPERQRSILYAAIALLAILLVASFLFTTSFAVSVLFLAAIIGLGLLIWKVWQDGRRYY